MSPFSRSGRVVVALLALSLLTAQAATIVWTGNGGDFSWQNPANWSAESVPGWFDDVVIPGLGDAVVRSTNAVQVQSLNCEGALRIAAGSITVTTGASTLAGPVHLEADAELRATGPGTLLTLAGPLPFSGGSLRVAKGATLRALDPTDLPLSGPVRIDATDAGSRVELPNLAAVTADASEGSLTLSTRGGAHITLPRLESIAAPIQFYAAWPESVIDLAGLRHLETWKHRDQIPAIGLEMGGAIRFDQLQRVLAPDGLTVSVRGATARLDLPRLSELSGSTDLSTTVFSTTEGATIAFDQLTALTGRLTFSAHGATSVIAINGPLPRWELPSEADGSHLGASAGGTVQWPQLAEIVALHGQGRIEADGADSRVELPGLKRVFSGFGSTGLQMRAEAGGTLQLPQLARIDGQLSLIAVGAGSAIQLTATNGLWTVGHPEARAYAAALMGGSIQMPGWTELNVASGSLDFQVDGQGSRLDLAGLATLRGPTSEMASGIGVQTVRGGHAQLGPFRLVEGRASLRTSGAQSLIETPSPASLTTLSLLHSQLSLEARDGATLRLPHLQLVWGEASTFSLAAGGQASRIELPNLNGSLDVTVRLSASSGGRLELPQIQSVVGGALTTEALGPGTLTDLSRLTCCLSSTNRSFVGWSEGGASVRLPPQGLLLANTTLFHRSPPTHEPSLSPVVHGEPGQSYALEFLPLNQPEATWTLLDYVPQSQAA